MSPSEFLLRPSMAPWLLVAPAVGGALVLLDRARARRLARAAGPRVSHHAASLGPRRRAVRRALFAAGVLLGFAALLEPAWGEIGVAVEPRGADVAIALDVSRSMLAGDVAPNRLERARREIASLAARARGDRLALVVFAGEARLLVPRTRDGETLAALAATADPLSVPRGGTDLAAALDAARGALADRGDAPGFVLLLTDGEDLEGRGRAAAARCAAEGIVVHAVGFGTPRGGKIAVEGAAGGAFLRDRGGREVVTALDPDGLAALAGATGGTFLRADAGGDVLASLYETRILPAGRGLRPSQRRRTTVPRFQWPLLAALLLWSLDLCLTDRKRS